MIELWDSFNDVFISRHFNLENAILAQRKHSRRLKKANPDEIVEIEILLDNEY